MNFSTNRNSNAQKEFAFLILSYVFFKFNEGNVEFRVFHGKAETSKLLQLGKSESFGEMGIFVTRVNQWMVMATRRGCLFYITKNDLINTLPEALINVITENAKKRYLNFSVIFLMSTDKEGEQF
jgi:hypothetical protein